MKIKNQLKIGRLIGKIDNDFNLSESDWIPRVAAWCSDALSQLNVLPMEKKKRKLEVNERLAQYPCEMTMREIRVFDMNGCEIPAANEESSCCGNTRINGYSQEIAVIDNSNTTGRNFMQVANIVNSAGRNFVIQGNCIELNFDTDYIITESLEPATYYDEYYDCQCPYIYDDGLLLEALAWYCLFKYLSRGSKHPVYSLTAQTQITNPYAQWLKLKSNAAASVKIKLNKDSGWNNFFYNSTVLPRT